MEMDPISHTTAQWQAGLLAALTLNIFELIEFALFDSRDDVEFASNNFLAYCVYFYPGGWRHLLTMMILFGQINPFYISRAHLFPS